MIGEGAGQRHRGFDSVKATRSAIALPPIGERPAKADLIGTGSERIGGECDKDVRVREARLQVQRPAIDGLGHMKRSGLGRFENMPAHVWKRGSQGAKLPEQGRRGHAPGQQP